MPQGGSTVSLLVSELHWQNACVFFLAKLKIDFQGYTNDGDDMLCLKVEVDFRKKRF